jgi:hypothetical protein
MKDASRLIAAEMRFLWNTEGQTEGHRIRSKRKYSSFRDKYLVRQI